MSKCKKYKCDIGIGDIIIHANINGEFKISNSELRLARYWASREMAKSILGDVEAMLVPQQYNLVQILKKQLWNINYDEMNYKKCYWCDNSINYYDEHGDLYIECMITKVTIRIDDCPVKDG